jgi:hypothetical protein
LNFRGVWDPKLGRKYSRNFEAKCCFYWLFKEFGWFIHDDYEILFNLDIFYRKDFNWEAFISNKRTSKSGRRRTD